MALEGHLVKKLCCLACKEYLICIGNIHVGIPIKQYKMIGESLHILAFYTARNN